MSRTLLLQLARLGDLIQSLPVIHSLRAHFPERQLDLLCAEPLVPLGRLFSGIDRVYPWEGERWHSFATVAEADTKCLVDAAKHYLEVGAFDFYPLAYNLNNHSRSILAAHLFSERVIGSGDRGPLNSSRPPWVEYLCHVAQERGTNRVHLADAFCGLSGVKPPVKVPTIQTPESELPSDLAQVMKHSSLIRIGIVLGAGDVDRRVPLSTWRRFIEACVEIIPNSLCVLIGGTGEKEAALALEDQLSPHCVSRILNCVGRTTLPQLAHTLNRCQWVVGSDTGPLHLGVACGTRAIGWYFSRARVHETGPYGVGHYVWQHQGITHSETKRLSRFNDKPEIPRSWPIMETIELIQGQTASKSLLEWKLWTSHRDDWGMFYVHDEKPDDAVLQRKHIWERLSSMSSINPSECRSSTMIAGCSL